MAAATSGSGTSGWVSRAKPGDLVVSFADIAAALQGQLTPEQINQLLARIIVGRKQAVAPGDLITSDLINEVLAEVADLQVRVLKIETQATNAGKLAIREVYPLDLEIGKELHVVGVNFGLPADNAVSFDGIPASVIFKQPPSGDQMLVFDMPPITIAGASQSVVFTVGNVRSGYDSRQITVRKAAPTIPDGSTAVVKFIKAFDGAAAADAFHVLQFSIDGSNTLNETYALRLIRTGNITVRPVTDQSGATELVPPVIPIAAPPTGSLTTTATAFVRVDIPAGATGPASMQLTADSQHNPARLSGTSSSLSFTIGSPWPGSPTITFQRIGVSGPGANVDTSTGVISFTAPTPQNSLCKVTFAAQGASATAYTATLRWDGAQNGWTASLIGNPLDPKWPLLTLPVQSGGGSVDLSVYLLAGQNTGTGSFVLSMAADNNPDDDKGVHTQIVKPTGL